MRKGTYPKTIFVYQEQDGTELYLVAAENLRELADFSETRKVGEYQLVETSKISVVIKKK